ncbi:NUDIX hydrolase [Enterococcus sp. LJL90]
MSIPTFGLKTENVEYISRYAVYVVLPNQKNELAIVQAPNGAYFLPGGEIEAGEDQLAAIQRELIEELGVEATLGNYYGQADEFFFSRHRDTYYYNPGYFYQVTAWQQVCEPTEKTNVIAWVAPEKAIELLKRGSHKWAVEQWLKTN